MDLHVVIVSDDARASGGASAVALASAKALAARDVRVTLFAGRGPVDDEARAALHEVVCLERGASNREQGGLVRGLWDRESAAALERCLEACGPRPIVHFHSFADVLTGSVTAVPHPPGSRAVFTLHEYGLACPYGGFYNYRTQAPCGRRGLSVKCWATACSTAPYPRKVWRAVRLSLQKARGGAPRADAAYLCVSEFSRDLLRPYLPERARVELLPNPIEVEDRGPAQVAKSEEFVYLGRLTEEKGAEVFAAAAERAGVRAKFVGDGEERARLAAAYPSCEFAGWLPADGAQRALRGARALVFPSRLYETLGMAVLEAAAMGVPAIVSDATAASGSIEPGVNGLVFRSGDTRALADALLAMTPEAAAPMGAEAHRRFWADPPTMERHVDGLLKVYKELLEA
ncbi:MAG: glycosyltransferase [Chthonomonadaceae bacterium]|nr:glycosyltransferase [Chthonomonadaceae bacterium]